MDNNSNSILIDLSKATSNPFNDQYINTSEEYGGKHLTYDWYPGVSTHFGQQQHLVEYMTLFRVLKQDPIVFAAIMATVDSVVSNGYRLVGGDDLAKAKLKEFFRKTEWNSLLRNIAFTMLIYDDVYVEVSTKLQTEEGNMVETGTVQSLWVLDSNTVTINYDQHGNVIDYRQNVPPWPIVVFQTDEVVHMRLNRLGSRIYGLSALNPLMFLIACKLNAEKYAGEFFSRSATPRLLYQMEGASTDDRDRLRTYLRTLQPYEDIIMIGKTSVSPVGAMNKDFEFEKYLLYLRQNIISCLQVPPILLGIPEGSNLANSDNQMQAFNRRVYAIQDSIAGQINNRVLPLIVGLDTGITFEFERVDKRDEYKDAQIVQVAISMGVMTINEARSKLGYDPVSGGDVFRPQPNRSGGLDAQQVQAINPALPFNPDPSDVAGLEGQDYSKGMKANRIEPDNQARPSTGWPDYTPSGYPKNPSIGQYQSERPNVNPGSASQRREGLSTLDKPGNAYVNLPSGKYRAVSATGSGETDSPAAATAGTAIIPKQSYKENITPYLRHGTREADYAAAITDRLRHQQDQLMESINLQRRDPPIKNRIAEQGTTAKAYNNDNDELYKISAGMAILDDSTRNAVKDHITNTWRGAYAVTEDQLDMNFFENERRLNKLLSYNYDLIDSLEEDTSDKVNQLIQQATIEEQDNDWLLTGLAAIFAASISRAENIARTETWRAMNDARIDSYTQSGVTELVWLTADDDKVCELCGPMEGQTFPMNYFSGRYPSDDTHPQCRCVLLPNE